MVWVSPLLTRPTTFEQQISVDLSHFDLRAPLRTIRQSHTSLRQLPRAPALQSKVSLPPVISTRLGPPQRPPLLFLCCGLQLARKTFPLRSINEHLEHFLEQRFLTDPTESPDHHDFPTNRPIGTPPLAPCIILVTCAPQTLQGDACTESQLSAIRSSSLEDDLEQQQV